MSKVYILQGLPASGKTTWAVDFIKKNSNAVRVNKDELRIMTFAGQWEREKEDFILEVRDFIIINALTSFKDVVVDDTNLKEKHINRISEVAKEYGSGVEILFFDTPLEECIKRNEEREAKVPEKVIRDMYENYIKERS